MHPGLRNTYNIFFFLYVFQLSDYQVADMFLDKDLMFK